MRGRHDRATFDRRAFVLKGSRRSVGFAVAAVGVPPLLVACAGDESTVGAAGTRTQAATARATTAAPATAAATPEEAAEQARAIIGDVVDFALQSDEWEGDFGFVTLQFHRGAVDGLDVWFIGTDTSDGELAEAERLVRVPKLAPLAASGLAGTAVLFDGGGEDSPRSCPPSLAATTPPSA